MESSPLAQDVKVIFMRRGQARRRTTQHSNFYFRPAAADSLGQSITVAAFDGTRQGVIARGIFNPAQDSCFPRHPLAADLATGQFPHVETGCTPVSDETVRNCAVIATSRISGTLPGDGLARCFFLSVLPSISATMFLVIGG
jgi:hypothetical protein